MIDGVIAKLTVRLIALPEEAWPRFTAGHEGAEPLPPPLQHAALAAAASALMTFIGSMLRPGWTAGGIVLQLLAGIVGYVGGAALTVLLAPKLLASSGVGRATLERYASGAVLPVAASGVFNIFPLVQMILLLALAGAALSAWSGWIGASAMLALEGEERKRAAAVPAVLAVSLVLAATLIRWWVLPK